jgi:hypothetical protein
MISAFLAFLSSLPVIGNIVTALTTSFFNAKVQLTAARIGGDVAVARAVVTAAVTDNQTKVGWLQAIGASPILSFVVVGFAFPFIFYLNKVVVYDICLGLGSTPPLKYDLLTEYGHIILSGIFVTSSTAGIAQAYFSRRN